MSDENSELDEIDFNSELESAETVSNASGSPLRAQDGNVPPPEPDLPPNFNIAQNLFRREIGLGCLKPTKQLLLRSYNLRNVFPNQVLLTHVFMGMTKCGRFLITYTMITDQDDDEWYATVYKYRLHWWTFKPGSQVRKIAEVSLFGNYKIVTPLQMYICQWPQDYEKILVYGLIKDCGSIDVSAPSNNQHAFVTVTALPSVNNCQDCRVVASSYMLDDIAASWDTCLRFSCLKHGYTVHTSFDVIVPYPEFVPKISLKCHDYAVFNTNNFLYAIKISLENCERKPKEDLEDLPYHLHLLQKCVEDESSLPSLPDNVQILTNDQKRALKIKEQIIQDFSEEINLNPIGLSKRTAQLAAKGNVVAVDARSNEAPCRFHNIETEAQDNEVSPSLPTRMSNWSNLTKTEADGSNSSDITISSGASEQKPSEEVARKEECSDRDYFRCPSSSTFLKSSVKREHRKNVNLNDKDCSKKHYKSFFSRHKVTKNNMNFGMLIRNSNFPKPALKPVKAEIRSSNLDPDGFALNADSAYEFVDDTQHEVEKLSQFRKKRLADKKYEFQDFDSENIVPFSIVRQENTLRSPRKSDCEVTTECEGVAPIEKTEIMLRSPSPRFPLDLSISVPSPRSPLLLEILSSPTQHEGVLRPFNRNTNGTQLLSPMAKYLASPPNAQKHTKQPKDCLKSKGCDEFKNTKTLQGAIRNSTNLDTRLILEHGILINDISERYFMNEYLDGDVYNNLFKNSNKFYGEAVRFERRFVEVDDELVSVITDVEDDDMSAVTGYHTALNLEVHGAGYGQLQMISNSKAERLNTPRVVVDQQSLDIEGICHSVATTLCHVSNKTFTFCNDYDIEVLDVCPRSGDVLVLLMMRIEGAEGIKDEVSQLEHYEASVTLVWNLHSGDYRVCMVVPPQRLNWVWDHKAVWNPAQEAAQRFRMQLPTDVTLCEPSVRVCANNSTLRGVSLSRIQDWENGVQFVL